MPLATEEWLPQVHPHLLEGPANRVDLHQGLPPFVLLSRPVDNFEFILCQPLQPVVYRHWVPESSQSASTRCGLRGL
ncbi:hypothetical protein T05_13743 [Trichinella murrelli]|uniref:Uncharacterized protein n=1 Tax=Trichinella murrelli TaxID=144512 RepID=A0A0V0TE36_9BILA|nr:hypothetical protein T05_13743 [Trichinella murrelli]